MCLVMLQVLDMEVCGSFSELPLLARVTKAGQEVAESLVTRDSAGPGEV